MNKKLARTGPRIRITKSLMRPTSVDGTLPSMSYPSDDKRYIYTCEHCGLKFTQNIDYFRHLIDNHKDQKLQFQCCSCELIFMTKANLHKHMQTHNQAKRESRSRCDTCSITFKSRYCLRKHQELKKLMQENSCKKCPKKFMSKEHLEKHVRNKHTFKYVIFYCSFCSLSFKFQDSMIYHLRRLHAKL